MMHMCLASILGLAVLTPASSDDLSVRAAEIEARVVALTQQNEAIKAGKIAAQAMRAPDLSRSDRYHLGGLAFDAYLVVHINSPSATALCGAHRVARAMARLAPTSAAKKTARALVGQANGELAKLRPPGACTPSNARSSTPAPALLAVATPAAVQLPAPGRPAPPTTPPLPVDPVDSSPDSSKPTPVTLALDPMPTTTSTSLPVVPTGQAAVDNSRRRWTPRAWAGLGTAVLGAGLVAGMGGSMRARWAANDVIVEVDRRVEAEKRVLSPEETILVDQASGRWHQLTAVAVVTGTLGAAALVTGAVLMATGIRLRVTVNPWGDRTSAGLLLSGRF